MPRNSLSIEQVLALLAATVPGIEAATEGLTPRQLRAAPAPGEWSLNEVLAHLRACADVWGGCMTDIAVERRRELRAINPLTWIRSTDYPELPFRESLHALSDQRSLLLERLHRLPPAAWERAATVSGAGAQLERTALLYGRWLAGHERSHRRQVEGTAAEVRRPAERRDEGTSPGG